MLKHATPRRLCISSWSVRHTLGEPHFYGPDNGTNIPADTHGQGEISLLQLPARVAAFGIGAMEITHFHLPSRDVGYLRELGAAMKAANVEPWTLLVDAGDLTDAQHGERDFKWIAGWLPVAAELGMARVRAIAGQGAPTQEAFERSAAGLAALATEAEAYGMRLTTENWFDLLAKPEHVWSLLHGLEGRIGLNFDFGNWKGPTKYDDLAEIAPLAESCHAKGDFSSGVFDASDFTRCLDLLDDADFSGPYTLIYGDAGDPWAGLAAEKALVAPRVMNILKTGNSVAG